MAEPIRAADLGRRSTTRRAFLQGAGALGAAGVALAALGPRRAAAAPALTLHGVLSGRVAPSAALLGRGAGEGTALLDGVAGSALVAVESRAVFRSPVLPLDFAATHFGLHWEGEGPFDRDLVLAVRSSPDGRDWTPWASVGASDSCAGHGEERFSPLLRLPPGAYAQYEARFGDEPGARLRRPTLSYLNPFDGPERPAPQEPRSADPFPFPFRSRAEWGCDEDLRFEPNGTESWPRMYVPVKKLVVHHTATTNDYTDAAAEVRAIYVYHAKELGWGDIGYQALIGRDGVVYEGRRGRGPARGGPRELLSPGVVGGHVYFHNYGSDGYALIGTFTDTPLPDLMRERLLDLLVYEARRYALDPGAVSDFLRNDGIWHRDVASLSGHRDLVTTECPGDRVYALLPSLRAALAARLGGTQAAAAGRVAFVAAPPNADTTLRALGAAWGGLGLIAPGWQFSYYLENWRRDGPYDILPVDNRPAWTPYDATTAAARQDLAPGHYTVHLRGRDPLGREAVYETNTTLHVVDALLADNEDAGQTARLGAWEKRIGVKGTLGESFEEAPAGRGERAFRWVPLVSEHGRYEVWVRWPDGEDFASNAPYAIAHADGLYTERRDQRANGGEWTRLGGERLFRFLPGRAGWIGVSNDADGKVAADAVRLVLRTRILS